MNSTVVENARQAEFPTFVANNLKRKRDAII
jgi:hypothetical protein